MDEQDVKSDLDLGLKQTLRKTTPNIFQNPQEM